MKVKAYHKWHHLTKTKSISRNKLINKPKLLKTELEDLTWSVTEHLKLLSKQFKQHTDSKVCSEKGNKGKMKLKLIVSIK